MVKLLEPLQTVLNIKVNTFEVKNLNRDWVLPYCVSLVPTETGETHVTEDS